MNTKYLRNKKMESISDMKKIPFWRWCHTFASFILPPKRTYLIYRYLLKLFNTFKNNIIHLFTIVKVGLT